MTAEIVDRLISWVRDHATDMEQRGLRIEKQFPGDSSPLPDKATVGFIFRDIVVTYTVWQVTILQTSLIVFNSRTKRTVFFRDSEPETPDVIGTDLADVVQKLLSGEYERMSSS